LTEDENKPFDAERSHGGWFLLFPLAVLIFWALVRVDFFHLSVVKNCVPAFDPTNKPVLACERL
jgi:hypothetical protein